VCLHSPALESEFVMSLWEVGGGFGDFSLHIFENIETRNRDLDRPDYAWQTDLRAM